MARQKKPEPSKLAADLGVDAEFEQFIVSFELMNDRLPDIYEIMLYHEAKASAEIDKDPNGQTHHA